MTKEEDAVLKYLSDTNRPYSATDITMNLHKEFGKTAVQKALDSLVEKKKVREKLYGKQKVFCIVQPETANNSQGLDNELKDLDAQINTLTDNLKSVETELKSSEAKHRDLQSALTTEEAEAQLAEVRASVEKLEKRLSDLSSSRVQISAKDREAIKKEAEKVVKEYRKRKRICTDILNSILENYPKPKKTLYEEVGIETDEDAGMKPIA
ncbi:homologous-pairing protein 2 homolog [Bemisia tabaci]|uniref:homologous-pairing protein 2 homolog n=1 Tax=Bemisia tabaci TaxID=7038 RepID=UPI003B28B33D